MILPPVDGEVTVGADTRHRVHWRLLRRPRSFELSTPVTARPYEQPDPAGPRTPAHCNPAPPRPRPGLPGAVAPGEVLRTGVRALGIRPGVWVLGIRPGVRASAAGPPSGSRHPALGVRPGFGALA
ncbi:hypothetical protein GCM10010508_54280 [Streptomyces naganishii JCM 4654]|uniref:Uncharacterized protein n=1 Tax=Streptomyces naganishii JCM 4654 TaxID=1306179 RepID=A0A919CXI4_9ACTN|nr:hypothetical protein GCM10010508_54280 [Streptomyces naganishii JCM 4654]